jgi:hypothetical protein
MSRTYRQGQLLLQRVLKLPPNARRWTSDDDARIVLAYDEATGHTNAVSTAFAHLFIGISDEERYIVTNLGARLVHEDYPPIELAPGTYKIVEPATPVRFPLHQEFMINGSEADSGVDFAACSLS